jgi:MYXO-CTERM domain-containing protein
MTRKLKIAIVAGAAAGLAIPALSSVPAAAEPLKATVYKVLDPDMNDLARVRDGRLRKTDEEFTNEQAVVQFFGDGKHAIYVSMRTGALPSGETPQHRMQASCTPLELVQQADGTVTFQKLQGETFITDNDGNEYRNANKPELMPINGGKNMLVLFNYQPNGTNDTRRYAKVLDQNCNLVTVKNGNGEVRKQVQVMAKNNDDADMHQTGEGPCDIALDSGGTTRLVCWAGANGNGRDDGWLNMINVSCQNGADGTATECTIKKEFDLSLCKREERSRGRCTVSAADPNTAICTWTEGNTQPQRDGTWIAAVDISTGGEQGENAQSRVIWKEQIEGRKDIEGGGRTYSVRAMHTRVMLPRADGTLEKSDMLFIRTGDLQGNNNNDKKGGTYRQFRLGVAQATKAGLTWVMPMADANDMFLGIDGTHLTMCGAVFGEGSNLMPGFTMMQGSQNGGGVTPSVIKSIGYDVAAKKWVDLGTSNIGASYDRHLYANYLGNNPGNQGRNFAGCTMVKNAYAGQNGSTAQYLQFYAVTGKDPEYLARPEIKPTSYISAVEIAKVAPPAPTPPPADPMTPPPANPGAGTGTGTGAGTGQTGAAPSDDPAPESPSMMGCTTAPGAAGGHGALLALVGLGALFIIRRRGA